MKPLWSKVEWLKSRGIHAESRDGNLYCEWWTSTGWQGRWFRGNPTFRTIRETLNKTSARQWLVAP